MKAMQKDPAARYENAAEMSSALEKFLDRDKKLKRKRQKQGSGDTSDYKNNDNSHKVSWLSWAALIAALVGVAAYLMHRI
ncbi:MAG: hypothetical protein HY254_21660 [Burkholderiales bacterium]|nr:hypothetical protein [Burkholderiales bacterium]